MSTTVHINSQYRSSGTFDDFIMNPSSVPMFSKIGLKNCIIPLSQYIINANNNLLRLNFGGPTLICTLTPGNYTALQFATELQTDLNITSGITGTFTVTYSSNTGLLTITNSSADFTLLFGTFKTSLNYIMGFAQSDTSSTANSLVAPYPLNLSPPNYLYLSLDNIGLKNTIGSSSQNCLGHWQIPLVGNSFSINSFNPAECLCVPSNTRFSQVRVSVRYATGELAGLLNDWACTFMIE
jgi:hypothetical protein